MLDRARNAVRLHRALRHSPGMKWARALLAHGIDPREAGCRPDGTGVYFGSLGVTVRDPLNSALLQEYRRATHIRANGVEFVSTDDGRLEAHAGGVRLNVETSEEIQILQEVFVDGAYSIDLSGKLLFIDIGMNAAYTSIYLAARHPGAIVCGFEPFAPTLAMARANIALNPSLADRIRTFDFGLGPADGQIEIEYSPRFRGSVGVFGVPAGLRARDKLVSERIRIRDSAAVLGPLFDEHADRRIVMKVDCEGSEYGILSRLDEAGLLGRAELLAVECHRRAPEHDPGALRARLVERGFACVHLQPDSPDISMLYAARARPGGTT